MKSIVCNIRNSLVLFFFFVFMFSQYAFCSDTNPPISMVKDFYQAYLNDEQKSSTEIISRYVSNNLSKNIDYSLKCNYDTDDSIGAPALGEVCAQKRDCKESKGSYICNWGGFWIESDVDYFTKSQDVYPSWKRYIKVILVSQTNKKSVLGVSLGAGSESVMRLKVTLKLNGNEWKIISVTE